MGSQGDPITWTTAPYTPVYKIRTIMESLDKELSTMFAKNDTAGDARQNPLVTTINLNSSILKMKQKDKAKGIPTEIVDSKLFNFERYKDYKRKAIQAYQNRKIYTVHGNYGAIRQALRRRGWLEKIAPNQLKALQNLSQHTLLRGAKDGNEFERMSLSKLLEHYPSFFIWQPKHVRDTHAYALPYRNRVRRGRELDFTTKLGLIGCAEVGHWNTIEGKAEIRCPRFYRLDNKDEHADFLQDYRMTQCFCLVSFIVDRAELSPLNDQVVGSIPTSVVNFAVAQIYEHIQVKDDKYIDTSELEENTTTDEQWESFISNSNAVIHKNAFFKSDNVEFLGILASCKRALYEAKKQWPLMHMDGWKNLWILKPGYMCRGLGIVILRSYDEIINYANRRPKSKYIVQKYIERPLLIHNTKFDIRQYMLITITDTTLNIWMYKDCYLRFSSQQFSLNDFKESVHLTNNSVQKKYKNGARSEKLPKHNMWHLHEFQAHLGELGKSDVWHKVIYPGMKQIIIGVVLASLTETEIIQNSFEMYGCDFMLDENFQPILIEVNSTPDLSHSTAVTKRLCPAAQEDLIKVVVDLPKNNRVSTGNFELIHQMGCPRVPSYIPGLIVNGASMKINIEVPPKPIIKRTSRFSNQKSNRKVDKSSTPSYAGSGTANTKYAGSGTVSTKYAGSGPTDAKLAGSGPTDGKYAGSGTTDAKLAGSRSTDSKPTKVVRKMKRKVKQKPTNNVINPTGIIKDTIQNLNTILSSFYEGNEMSKESLMKMFPNTKEGKATIDARLKEAFALKFAKSKKSKKDKNICQNFLDILQKKILKS